MKYIFQMVLLSVGFGISIHAQGEVAWETLKHTSAPAAVVKEFWEGTFAVMRTAEQKSYAERVKAFEDVIGPAFNLQEIARISLGKIWKKELDSDERRRFVEVFSRFVVSFYAYNFAGYKDETYKYIREGIYARHKKLPDNRFRGPYFVETVFVVSEKERIKFQFSLKKYGEKWKIINIIYDSVSDLARKSSRYRKAYNKNGFDGLINDIENKILGHQQEDKY